MTDATLTANARWWLDALAVIKTRAADTNGQLTIIEVTEPPRLHGMFFNDRDSRRDHVALFVVRAFRQASAPVPDHEIVAHGFFAVDELPNDTTAGTRARIVEVLGGTPVSERW